MLEGLASDLKEVTQMICFVGGKMGTIYLDILVRFVVKSKLFNLHLLAIPLHGCKNASSIFTAATKMLEVLSPKWKSQLMSVSTDGEPTMTGFINGVATQFANA
eukprot:IDg3807t1